MTTGTPTTGTPVDLVRSWARHEHYAFRILSRLSADPDRVVLHRRGRAVTGAELRASVLAAVATFRRLGVRSGQTVAVLTEANQPTMLVARYAAHLLGAATVHIRSANPRSDASMLSGLDQARIMRSTGARVLVVDRTNLERARRISRDVSGEIRLAGYDVSAPDVASFGNAGDAGDIATATGADPFGDYSADRTAMVGFTSGSTGQPKGVIQSFRAWNSMVDTFAGTLDPTEPSRILLVTPMSHTVGSMVDAVIAAGGCAILHERFDVTEVLRACTELRVTDTYFAVPHLYHLVDHPGTTETDLASLRRVIYSGSVAAPRRIAQAVRVFGDAITQLYGTTEAGGITSLTPMDHREPELLPTVGRPFPWTSVRICGPGSDRELPHGQRGEVCVRSAAAMDGYLDDPASTALVLRDGWLHTGDLGYRDRYGYLRLVGRIDDVIKTGGLKVYPTAVEQALLAHRDVAAATVYGVPDADRVEQVHAAVVLRSGATCTDGQLRDQVSAVLSPLCVPGVVTRLAELPLNAAGKPDRAYLRSLEEAPVESEGGSGR